MHGRDHQHGGADPTLIAWEDLGAVGSYEDVILAEPTLAHFWPADETSGNLIDRKGTWNLAPIVAGGFPQYGAAGPFASEPAATAVVNDGAFTSFNNRFEHNYGSPPAYWTGAAPSTVEAWVYMTANPDPGLGSGYILNAPVLLYVWHATPKLTFQHGGAYIEDPAAFPLNAWQHIVGRYTGTTLELFRNGSLVASGSGGSYDNPGYVTWLNLGAGASSWRPFRGRAAQLAIYNGALGDSAIANHYSYA